MRCPYCNSPALVRVSALERKCQKCGKNIDVRIVLRAMHEEERAMTKPRPKPKEIKTVHEPHRNLFWVFNHQGKADQLICAIQNKMGLTLSDYPNFYRSVKFALTDKAVWGRVRHLERMKGSGVNRFFIYPHAARPNLLADVEPEWPGVTAQFVSAPGHVKIMKTFNYHRPVHVIGWLLCPQKPFQPREQARNILFAPIHPRCDEIDKEVNRKTFDVLVTLAKRDKINLTVRYISKLSLSGLDEIKHKNIRYTPGQMNNGYKQIDATDVVVSHQTFAYIAVPRGVPTVMMGERELPVHYMRNGKPLLFAKHWDEYVDILAYPLDILAVKDPLRLLKSASKSDYRIRKWRREMIGEPFSATKFIKILESYL